jgi:hypothetical protein
MYKNIAFLIIGTIILCFAAFHNKFPLMTTDTGAYITAGFTHTYPPNYIGSYGIFIAHSSWGKSIWLIIFSQTLLLSLVLFYCFLYFSRHPQHPIFFLASICFITFFMSASVVGSTVSPDVFISIALLGTGLLLFAKNLSSRSFIIIAVITLISACMNLSSLIAITLIAIIYSITLVLRKSFPPADSITTNIKNIVLITAVAISAWLLLFAEPILSGDRSAIIWKKITAKQLRQSPRATYTVKNWGIQMINSQSGQHYPGDEHSPTFQSVYKWYNIETREYTLSRQYQHWLSFEYLNYSQAVSIFLFALMTMLFFVYKKKSRYLPLLYYFSFVIVLQLLIDILLFRQLPATAYQAIWLLSVPAFLHLSEVGYVSKKAAIEAIPNAYTTTNNS